MRLKRLHHPVKWGAMRLWQAVALRRFAEGLRDDACCGISVATSNGLHRHRGGESRKCAREAPRCRADPRSHGADLRHPHRVGRQSSVRGCEGVLSPACPSSLFIHRLHKLHCDARAPNQRCSDDRPPFWRSRTPHASALRRLLPSAEPEEGPSDSASVGRTPKLLKHWTDRRN